MTINFILNGEDVVFNAEPGVRLIDNTCAVLSGYSEQNPAVFRDNAELVQLLLTDK